MILNVKNLSHGFGDRAIFEDVSFRLLRGEHIGLIGANGEGKSTFMNIITGKLMPDEGTVEWAKNVRVGYLDQHAVLEKGLTIRDVLKSAFSFLFEIEETMNRMFEQMGEAGPEEMDSFILKPLYTRRTARLLHDRRQGRRDRTGAGPYRNRAGPRRHRAFRWTAHKGIDGKASSGKAGYPAAR